MSVKVKELADFHNLNVDVMQAIYDDITLMIVRECLAQADKIRDGFDEDDEKQQALGADWVGLAISRHFGIEE
jgi:hypothetical protein